ncbi:MAG: hypothetical protein MZU79_01145, partial [Anaerotruncus sp.]|nr:hypothetical protein [Anaerotruncus sp.]
LDKAPSLRRYIPAVRHHHERQDGKGYPDRLSGDNIPLFASIIAVADTFDAMTSTRPYRKAFSEEEALRELVRVAGTQLRADLVAVFVELIDERTPSMNPRLLRGQSDDEFSKGCLVFLCPHPFTYLPIMCAEEKLAITTTAWSNTESGQAERYGR